jgi:SAM-dependent methyltransferase
MERLSLTSKVTYNAAEAAIHMARYQLAAPYCTGKRILDVACGEGYGSHTLKQLGALAVDGVDNSPRAITNAQALFSSTDVRFHLHDAEKVHDLFVNETFDVIVSLETIEHLRNPARFLQSIKQLAKADTVIIISCPNDLWYYPTADQSNPFHLKKYSFEAFRDLTTRVLGGEADWGYGAPVIGFGTITDDLAGSRDPLQGQTAMLDYRLQVSAIALPPRGFSNVGPRNCSYFVGVWGGNSTRLYTSAIVPISMDDYSNLVSWEAARTSPQQIGELEKERSALLSEKQQLELRVSQISAKIDDAEVLRMELQCQAKTYETKIQSALQVSEKHRVQAFALGKELELVGRQLEQFRILNAQAHDQLAACQKEIDKSREEASELKRQKDEREHNLDVTCAELLALTKHAEQLSAQVAEIEAKHDVAVSEREKYRIQSFALAKEVALLSTQVAEITLQRDASISERDGFSMQLLTLTREIELLSAQLADFGAQRDLAVTERDSYSIQVLTLSKQIEQLSAQITELCAMSSGQIMYSRGIGAIKSAIITVARQIRPYLPPFMLAAAQRVARALGL